MSESLAGTLFQSRTRTSLLELLFVRKLSASVSELSRRAGVSPRAMGNEVRHLLSVGLVSVDRVAASDVVRANLTHSAALHLEALLRMRTSPSGHDRDALRVRQSLAWWGAPLAEVRKRNFSLEESLLLGLEEATTDGTVLRVLPTLLAKRGNELDWRELKEGARRRKLKAQLGMLVELTSGLVGNSEWPREVEELRDRRTRTPRFFPAVKSPWEAELARSRTPEVAKRWGLWMNVSEESFKSTLELHGS